MLHFSLSVLSAFVIPHIDLATIGHFFGGIVRTMSTLGGIIV